MLVTSWNFDNVRRLLIDSTGNLTDTGETLAVTDPMNVYCATDVKSGYVVRLSGSITSFGIPGLEAVDTHSLAGGGISGLIDPAGDRVYVRRSGFVDAFGFDSVTGALSPVPSLTIPTTGGLSSFFGMDQMALHPNGIKLYVSQSGALNVYDATTGALLTSITDQNIVAPTGVCFPTPDN